MTKPAKPKRKALVAQATKGKQKAAPRALAAAPAKAELDPTDRYLVPALIRGLNILEQLSDTRRRLTLSEIAASLGVTRSSAYRLLVTLGHMGFVIFDNETKTYALGAQVLRLGYAYLAARDIVEVAVPHLTRLRDRTGWSAHLGELDGRDVVYLARVPTLRSIASTVHVGTRLPARSTTMGRILLSGLPGAKIRDLYRDEPFGAGNGSLADLLEQLQEDRVQGVVVQEQGYEPGVASVAAPIRDVTGKVIGAINISVVALLTNEAELNGALKAEVLAAAEEISRDIGFDAGAPAAKTTARQS